MTLLCKLIGNDFVQYGKFSAPPDSSPKPPLLGEVAAREG